MSLPLDLHEAIERAHSALMSHPEQALVPIWRRDIYSAFGSASDPRSEVARGWLGVVTAQRVLPIWQGARPDDKMPVLLLDTAVGVLGGTADPDTAREEAGKAWDQLERLGSTPEGFAIGNAFNVGEAAVEALFEALGRDPFRNVLIDEHDTDSDLDPWCSDTALYAAVAHTGPTWETSANPARRREFWEWWLKEAIPAAWEASAPAKDSGD